MVALTQPCQSGASGIAMDSSYHEKTKKIQEDTLAQSYGVAFAQIADMVLPESGSSQPVCFLDLGAADGINSIPLFRGLVQELRKRDADRPILLVFEDQQCNDFSRIHSIDAGEFGSQCFPTTSSIGFFDCTVPPGTVHLSFSSHSMHYLSGGPPCNLVTTGLKDTDAHGAEKAAFAAAAAADWEKLLLARAAELAPGGRTVISNLCVDESTGWYYGSTDYGRSLYTELSDCLRSMVADGLLTSTEFEWATSPEYYRTVAELRAPFQDEEGPVRQAGLVLRSADVQATRCPWRREWLAGEHTDALEYGRSFAHVVTSFSYSKCARAFSHPGNARTAEAQKQILDEVYERFAHRVAADPVSIGVDTVCLVMVIEKQP